MGEDWPVPAMGLIDGGSNRFARENGKRRKLGGREQLQAVRPAIQELLRSGKCSGGIRHLGHWELH